MMDEHNTSKSDVNDEQLAGYFFAECDDADREAIKAQIERQPELAQRLEAWRSTMAMLDEADCVPASLTFAARSPGMNRHASAQPGLRNWWRRHWVQTALAAGIVLVVSLFLIGIEVRSDRGALVVTFGNPQEALPVDSVWDEAQAVRMDVIDQAVQERTDARLTDLTDDLVVALAALEDRRREDLASLLGAIGRMRRADLEYVDRVFASLANESAQQSMMTRASILELIDSGRVDREEMY